MNIYSQRSIEYCMIAICGILIVVIGISSIDPLHYINQQLPAPMQNHIIACDSNTEPSCRLAVSEWSSMGVEWLNNSIEPLFTVITVIISFLLSINEYIFTTPPSWLLMLLFTAFGYFLGGVRLSSFIVLALSFVMAVGFFTEMMVTLSLVVTATFLALVFGIPIGIIKAHSYILTHIINPILDFMQTMPLFVYLIPAVLFFSIGNIPGVVATFIFATPPAVRLTSLGIEQIPDNLRETGFAFGANPWQYLTKIEIPIALPSIMAGVNQSIMLALSMVVVAAMVGAEGLGFIVFQSITRLDVGTGIASGISIVLLAMILDKLTNALSTRI